MLKVGDDWVENMSRNRWALLIGMNDLSKARSCILPSWPTTFYIIYVIGTRTIKKIFMRFYADIDKFQRNRIALPFTSSWKIRCISLPICFQGLESNDRSKTFLPRIERYIKHNIKHNIKHFNFLTFTCVSNLKANCI